MIHVIMGLKGSGKTKKLIDAINAAVAEAHGDVVCIEYGKKLTYDVTYKVRLVDSREYGISRIHNDFEVARNEISAWETHRRAGFRELGVEDGFLQMMITKEDYFAHLDTD